MRHGITILTDLPWREAAPRWTAAEAMGFAHGWTYDHLIWEGLPVSPWAAAMPTLAAAASVTSRLQLGTFVASPNFRHPYPFLREIAALVDISQGRFLCGLGLGGDVDARLLRDDLTLGERAGRFREFVGLLDRLMREDDVTHEGRWYGVHGARTLPTPLRARTPVLVAANGPRSLTLAATLGDGWVTYGGHADDLEQWWRLVAELADRFSEAEAAAGRAGLSRILSVDSSPVFSYSSVALFEDLAGRAEQLGFTDLVSHWPRPDGPYAGDVAVLEEVAARVDLSGGAGTVGLGVGRGTVG